MKDFRLNILLLICLVISCVSVQAQQGAPRKNAFVLIDVSGSMQNDAINKEAKQHIKDILLGKFSLPDANRQGWAMQHKCNILENSKPILQNNSFFAIIPFGDKERYDERTFNRFSNIDNEFDTFFEKNYRLDHKDNLTYLTLAQGYAGSLAKARGVEKSYMIIYTDALNDQTGSKPYTDYENSIVDSWNVFGINNYNTLGVLSKKSGIYTYKIYIGQLDIYDVEVRDKDKPTDQIDGDESNPTPKITITNPKNSSIREPAKAKTKDEISVSWIGATNASIAITKYNGKNYVRLSSRGKEEAKILSKGGNSAKIVFYDSGKYKLTISKGSVSASAYYEVSSPIPVGLIVGLLLLLVAVIAGIRFLPNLFKPKRKNVSHPSSSGDKNDDW